MKAYISDLKINDDATTYFLVLDSQVRRTKADKPYLVMNLGDKTGQVEGRLWDIPADLSLKTNDFIKVQADVSEWNGSTQLTVRKLRVVAQSQFEAEGIELGDFLERSKRDPKEMWDELNALLGDYLANYYLDALVGEVLSQHREAFCKAPAGKSIHHNYVGGLLEHTLSLCKLTLQISDLYQLDTSLMLTACCLHDVGKLVELSYAAAIEYTVEGTLLGHICIGMEVISKAIDAIPSFPHPLKVCVLHMVASHHGLLEYGSPKIPLMKEAIAFHLCDMLDSRMAICDRTLEKGINEKGLSEWSRELGGPLFKLLPTSGRVDQAQEVLCP